jgi:enterochelin esterase-like enzyme
LIIEGAMPRPRSQAQGQIHDLGALDIPEIGPRRVRVYVPPGAQKQRPALYLFDGQNVFDDAGSYAGGWHAHRALDRMVAARRRIVPLAIAIDHGGASRLEELSPWGKADALVGWIASALVPRVERDFQAIRGPVGAAIAGSSMGGLAALYAHHRFPATFGGAISMSPSLWLKGRAIFGDVAARPRPHPSRVYLDCGAREAGGRMLPLVADMARVLSGRGYDDAHLMFHPDPRGGHDERSWRRRLPRALRFMYRA